MKEREFRELQVSSTQLAVIFLGILVLGVVIFLLGVSVGKKHAQEAEKASLVAEKQPEVLKDKIILPSVQTKAVEETKVASPKESQTKQEAIAEKKEGVAEIPKPAEKEKASLQAPAPSRKENLYYIQVGALTEKPAALALAQQFKNQGYPTVVLEPLPTDRIPYFRVRIGGFATKAEAEALKARLAGLTRKADYFIVRD